MVHLDFLYKENYSCKKNRTGGGKCCQELSKLKKWMETNIKRAKIGSKHFFWLFNFHATLLHEWREKYNNEIINCSNCSRFKDKLPIGMFIELDFSSLNDIKTDNINTDKLLLPQVKLRRN